MCPAPSLGSVVSACVGGRVVTGTVVRITPHDFLDFDHYWISTADGAVIAFLDEIGYPVEPAPGLAR